MLCTGYTKMTNQNKTVVSGHNTLRNATRKVFHERSNITASFPGAPKSSSQKDFYIRTLSEY